MDGKSLWLGRLRRPMWVVMVGLLAVSGLIWLWLVIGAFFLDSGVTMQTILRPGDHTLVKILLWLILAASLATALYLSDTRGAIEAVFRACSVEDAQMILGKTALKLFRMEP